MLGFPMGSQPGCYTEKSEMLGPKRAGHLYHQPAAKYGLKGRCWRTLVADKLSHVSDIQLAKQDLRLKSIPVKLNQTVEKTSLSPSLHPIPRILLAPC